MISRVPSSGTFLPCKGRQQKSWAMPATALRTYLEAAEGWERNMPCVARMAVADMALAEGGKGAFACRTMRPLKSGSEAWRGRSL